MAKQPYKMTKLSEIRPYERNPRIIPQAAVDAVARSIQAFGFRQPIVVDGNGVILAGHTRYKAAQQLGLEEVPVVWQTDITDLQARGYRIADNKTAEISAWDREALDDEVRQIAAQYGDFDVKDLGLSDWEIQRILQSTEQMTMEYPAPLPAQPTPAARIAAASTSEECATSGQNVVTESNDPPELLDLELTIHYSESQKEQLASLLRIGLPELQRRKHITLQEWENLRKKEQQP